MSSREEILDRLDPCPQPIAELLIGNIVVGTLSLGAAIGIVNSFRRGFGGIRFVNYDMETSETFDWDDGRQWLEDNFVLWEDYYLNYPAVYIRDENVAIEFKLKFFI